MQIETFDQRWISYSIPASVCLLTSLEDKLVFKFFKNNKFFASETENSTEGVFTLENLKSDGNKISGDITFRSYGWTERARLWNNKELRLAANKLDFYFHKMCSKSVKFILDGKNLKFCTEEGDLYFKSIP